MGNPWAARDASFLIQDPVAPLPRPEVIARGLVRWLKSRGVESIAVVADEGDFPRANAVAILKSAQDAGIRVTVQRRWRRTPRTLPRRFIFGPNPSAPMRSESPVKPATSTNITVSS